MKFTPFQRRQRIMEMAKRDRECGLLLAEYESANRRFAEITDRLPAGLRRFLWKLPGTGYYLHHRMLTLICENMRFPEETKDI